MGKLYGHGFDPDVCEGCPKHEFFEADDAESLVERIGNAITKTKKGYWGCGLCGCPTGEGLMMDRLQSPPEDCIRLDAHEGQ